MDTVLVTHTLGKALPLREATPGEEERVKAAFMSHSVTAIQQEAYEAVMQEYVRGLREEAEVVSPRTTTSQSVGITMNSIMNGMGS